MMITIKLVHIYMGLFIVKESDNYCSYMNTINSAVIFNTLLSVCGITDCFFSTTLFICRSRWLDGLRHPLDHELHSRSKVCCTVSVEHFDGLVPHAGIPASVQWILKEPGAETVICQNRTVLTATHWWNYLGTKCQQLLLSDSAKSPQV
jgi:hypothetical protein